MGSDSEQPSGSGVVAGKDKKRFEVKKWNAVALWAWDIVVDNCAICRNHIWTCASSAKPTRPPPPARSAQWLGEYATMPSISTAYPAGSRLARCVPWITATGSSRNTATSQFQKARQDVEVDRRPMLTHMLAHYFLP